MAVVICTYADARWTQLVAVVDSIRGQARMADSIIVVVDHNPELLERARRRWPDVVVVPNAEQRGLSGARNTGVASS